jgi:DNA polymerase alpha subunit A
LAEMNRKSFGVLRAVVEGYLDKSGWGWVSMDGLFGFALKALQG